jgi:hypothetical protein
VPEIAQQVNIVKGSRRMKGLMQNQPLLLSSLLRHADFGIRLGRLTQARAGRLAMARQFAELAAEPAEKHRPSMGENVQVIDFSRRTDPRTRRE